MTGFLSDYKQSSAKIGLRLLGVCDVPVIFDLCGNAGDACSVRDPSAIVQQYEMRGQRVGQDTRMWSERKWHVRDGRTKIYLNKTQKQTFLS